MVWTSHPFLHELGCGRLNLILPFAIIKEFWSIFPTISRFHFTIIVVALGSCHLDPSRVFRSFPLADPSII